MDINSLYSYLELPYIHIIIIYSLYLLTWWKSIFGGWVIDDDFGIQQFSDKFRPESKEKGNGAVIPELLVDYYNQTVGKDEKGQDIVRAYKNLEYNPHLGFPGAFMRWHRLQIGKAYRVIGKNLKGHEVWGWVQSTVRHHVWSMLVHAVSLLLCYNFLSFHFGASVAFPATLLFAIHPVINQCLAWISGINYLYCLTFLLANYNILQMDLSYYWTIPLTILCTFLSSLTLLVGCFNFATLYILGYHWEAFAALIVGILMMLRDGGIVVNYRRTEFKKQNMTSTITPNVRKPVVMLKTLWYYICLVIVPKRLGLYHEFGYNYSRKDEEPSAMFWLGLLSLVGFGVSFWYGDFLTRFCIIWFLSYFAIFSNFLTANQFVVERYIFIPSLAYCVLFARYLYPYPVLFWLFIGLYAMRSSMHIWTYKDHISFYTSNIQNFPNSEVAYGNLGCAYQGAGMSGSAFDFWMKATKINPHYDVPWYNMHSLVKGAGDLVQARDYLKNCMNAQVVHFKDTWEKDMAELENTILKNECLSTLSKEMNESIASGKYEIVTEIKKKMDVLMKPETRVEKK